MTDGITALGNSNLYAANNSSAGADDKGTLTLASFIKLLASQLANQDMSNPMSNSEMMAQMTQMAMVQSMTAMNDAITVSTAVTSQTYAAGLVGQELTVAVTEKGEGGYPKPVGVKYGTVESVNLVGSIPILKLKDDTEDYPLSYVLGIGRIDDPYADKDDDDDDDKDPDDDDDKKLKFY